MANIFIHDDAKEVIVKITINTIGEWEYDYKHNNGKRFPGMGVPMPTAKPFPHEYQLSDGNIGKSDFWSFRIINVFDRDIDYSLHIEWWQEEKLTEEWDREGTVEKSEPVMAIVGEGKFKQRV